MKMKKNKLLIISAASCLGLSLIGAGVGLALHKAPAKGTEVLEDATLPEDAIGARVKLGVDDGATDLTATPAIDAKVGLLVKDGEAAGTKDVRVYAKLNTVAGVTSAYITRKVTAQDGTTVKAEQTLTVGYAYSSLKGADGIKWFDTTDGAATLDETATADSPYYIVYTLKGIPEGHLLDLLEVKIGVEAGATNSSATITCNAVGAEGDQAVNVDFVALTAPGYEGEYGAHGHEKVAGPVVVPENYYTYDGAVATFMGKVTALTDQADLNGYTGAFEGFRSTTSITLPDTIRFFDTWCFYNCEGLTELTLPRDLTTISSSVFNGTSITTVDYDAVNLTTVGNFLEGQDMIFNVSADVESLPNSLVSSYGTVKQVNFAGTTAEWEALKTEENANNGLFIYNVICSDTVVHQVTWHIGEGTIGEDLTGDYETTAIDGKTVEGIGTPSLEGKQFKGWFLDAEGTTPWDPEAPVTGDLDVYAVYEDFGPGVSAENPYVLSATGDLSFNLVKGFDKIYMTYTMPADAAADWRYLYVNEDASEKADDSPASWLYNKISVYEGTFDEANLIGDVGEATVGDTSKVQEVGNDGAIRFYAEPGKTYCLLVDPVGETTYYDAWYGTLALKFADYENDDVASCQTLTKGVTVDVIDTAYEDGISSPDLLYKYVAGTNESLALSIGRLGYSWSSVYVYDVTDPEVVVELADDRGTSDSTCIIDAQAGHTYVFAVSFNDVTNEEEHTTLTIVDAPAGTTLGNPAPMTVGETVTAELLNGHSEFRTVTVEDGDYSFLLDGGSDSYAKYFVVYDAEGTEVVAKTVETGTYDGWYGQSYGGELLHRAHLNAGTYTIEIGYNSSYSSSTTFTFTMGLVEAGDYIGHPLVVDMEAATSGTYEASEDGFFLAYTPTEAVDGKYLVVNLDEAADGTEVHFVDAEGNDLLSTEVGGHIGAKLTAGEPVYIMLDGAAGQATLSWAIQDEYEDGLNRDTAFDITDDIAATGEAGIEYTLEQSSGVFWFKFSVAEAGTYVVYSKSSGVDTALRGIYAEGSEDELEAVGDDDDNNAHPETEYEDDFAYEVALEANTVYYMEVNVGYRQSDEETIALGAKLTAPGDVISTAIDTDFLTGEEVALAGSENGKFYKDVAETDGYYTVELAEAATGTVEVWLNGRSKFTIAAGKFGYVEVSTGDEVVLKVVGEGEQNVTATYSLTVEDGTSRENAVTLQEGLNDVAFIQGDSSMSNCYFKFTVSTTGTYKVYTQSVGGTEENGIDPCINGIYDSIDGKESLSFVDSTGKEDDHNRHPETIYKYDSYVEVELTAGVTYYMALRLPIKKDGISLAIGVEMVTEPAA